MKIHRGKHYAVITGDIVGSSRLPGNDRRKLPQVMQEGADALRKVFGKAVLGVDTFRGDGWQLVVTNPVKSLRIGLFYRAFLRTKMQTNKVDTRMAIAVGMIEFIPGKRVSEGDGEAFRRSGGTLEKMIKPSRIRFVLTEKESEGRLQAIEVVLMVVDLLAMNWTERQAQAIIGSVQGWTQEKIAAKWWRKPISQQAVAQHLDRAGWYAVDKGINFFENNLSELLNLIQSPEAILENNKL